MSPRLVRLFWLVVRTLLGVAAAAGFVVLALWWLVATESGLGAATGLVAVLTGGEVRIESATGRLAGPLQIGALHIRRPDLHLDVQGITLYWRSDLIEERRLVISALTAERVEFSTPPDEAPKPPTVPELLSLPLPVAIQRLSVGELLQREWIADEPAASAAQAEAAVRFSASGLVLSAESDGRHHRIHEAEVQLPFGHATVSGEIDGTAAPYRFAASGSLQGVYEGRDYRIEVQADGDLVAPRLQLKAEGAGLHGDAEVLAAPFAPVPLRRARVALGELDPALFKPQAPHAALHLLADLQPEPVPDGTGWGVIGPIRIDNKCPAKIDRQGLPFTQMSARIRWVPGRLNATDLSLSLPGKGRMSGDVEWRMPASGTSGVGSLTAALQLAAVELAQLDGRLPATAVAGRLQAKGDEAQQHVELDVKAGAARVGGAGTLTAVAGGKTRKVAAQVAVDIPSLADLQKGYAGSAKLDAVLAGTLDEPEGSLQLEARKLAGPDGYRLASLVADAKIGAGADGLIDVKAELSDLTQVGPERTTPQTVTQWVDRASFVASGRRSEHVAELTASGLAKDSVRLRLQGGLPGANWAAVSGWQGRLMALETAGRFPLRLEDATGLEFARGRMTLAPAVVDAGERGRIRLVETEWTPARTVLRGSLSGLGFGLVPGADGMPKRAQGSLILGAEWNLRLEQTAEGSARIFRESGDLELADEVPVRLGLQQAEVRLSARENRIALGWEARGTEFGQISGSATALAERGPDGAWRLAPDAPLLGSASLKMPSLTWIGRLMQEHVVTGGSVDASLALSGTPANPRASGRIDGSALALALVDQGMMLSGGDLHAEFDRDHLYLRKLEFVSPNRVRPNDSRLPVDRLTREPGRLSVVGQVALDSGAGDFHYEATRLPILQRADRWLILSGSGTAKSTWTSVDVVAKLRADAGFVGLAESPPPALSDDVVILGRTPKQTGSTFGVGADVTMSFGDHFQLTALGLDTRLAGELHLLQRPGRGLSAVGSINAAGGTYRGYGQTMSIERGLINFQGPLDNPGLNVRALRKGLAVEAGIEIDGTVRRPRVHLVSEPNVPDPEKLSWIVFGRAPNAGRGADLGMLLPAAQALLGGPGGGMTEQLQRSLGFDELSIGQGELGGVTRTATSRVVGEGTIVSGGENVSTQVLTVGKRLSSDLMLSFEQSLGGAESLVRLTYQLTRQLSLVARSGTDNSADIYFTISFE
ncbi:MAG TPA: translocation/assembly module TamB domain-containing protein [Aromatoleum sp.]|uniref:translocation/assembly module TamB domain-containing protein n=1 Tax=Aromatoleum sp. TaxID=2307007 RepID=UPI002B45968A|nr:translocation/assembly module TamB domain-containing protein [Aromatoleum sp.]HJV27540.1 translocation/assembly module TamB domain-containing protein [Aromatoleum sp.]